MAHTAAQKKAWRARPEIRARITEQDRLWRLNNPSKVLEYSRKHRAKNIKKLRARDAQYQRERRAAKGHKRPSLADRFFSRVDMNGSVPAHRPELGPCHMWLGSRRKSKWGYGQISVSKAEGGSGLACNGKRTNRMVNAQRVAFFLAEGRWPEPNACHHCDNPPCVNRAHLFEGTNTDNMRDCAMKQRGLGARGERNGHAKLTTAKIVEIRAAILRKESTSVIAFRYDVSRSVIQGIARGAMWKGIGV